MKLIPREAITIPPRQRKTISPAEIEELKQAILSPSGLLHAPVVTYTDPRTGAAELVAGHRRLLAIDEIAKAGLVFTYDHAQVMPGFVPVTFLYDLTPEELFETEFVENELRAPLSWQDRAMALSAIAANRRKKQPDLTREALADEIGAKTSTPASTIASHLLHAEVVAKNLSDPVINQARNVKEAYQLTLKREHAKYQAELVRKKHANTRQTTLRADLHVGDATVLIKDMQDSTVDLILTDPPYGLNAGNPGYRERSVHHHSYTDTPEYAQQLLKMLLVEGWRVCKPKANLFIFTEIMHWTYLQTQAAQMGWSAWRWPIIWQKSEHEGLITGWGRTGFIRTYDTVFWATKGQRGLLRPELDVLTEKRVSRSLRVHAAEKPIALLELLIDLTTLPGEMVLDPFAGSGSTLVAAKRQHRHSLGFELDPDTADEALVRIDNADSAPDAKEAVPKTDDTLADI